jgi:hypothetical protein
VRGGYEADIDPVYRTPRPIDFKPYQMGDLIEDISEMTTCKERTFASFRVVPMAPLAWIDLTSCRSNLVALYRDDVVEVGEVPRRQVKDLLLAGVQPWQ